MASTTSRFSIDRKDFPLFEKYFYSQEPIPQDTGYIRTCSPAYVVRIEWETQNEFWPAKTEVTVAYSVP